MLDLDRLQVLGRQRLRAQARVDAALAEGYDAIAAAYVAGGRVNVKRAAELLGVTRQEVYREMDRRSVRR